MFRALNGWAERWLGACPRTRFATERLNIATSFLTANDDNARSGADAAERDTGFKLRADDFMSRATMGSRHLSTFIPLARVKNPCHEKAASSHSVIWEFNPTTPWVSTSGLIFRDHAHCLPI